MHIPGLAIVVGSLVVGAVAMNAQSVQDVSPPQIDLNKMVAVMKTSAAAPPGGPAHGSHASHVSHRSHFSSSPKPQPRPW